VLLVCPLAQQLRFAITRRRAEERDSTRRGSIEATEESRAAQCSPLGWIASRARLGRYVLGAIWLGGFDSHATGPYRYGRRVSSTKKRVDGQMPLTCLHPQESLS
jgi:hypothetical protein